MSWFNIKYKEPPKQLLSLFSVGHGHGPALKSDLFLWWDSLGKKLIFQLQVISNWRQPLGWGQGHVSTSPLSSKTPSGADWCRTCACCLLRLWELTCAPAPMCLPGPDSLVSPSARLLHPFCLLQGSLSPKRKDLAEISLLRSHAKAMIRR